MRHLLKGEYHLSSWEVKMLSLDGDLICDFDTVVAMSYTQTNARARMELIAALRPQHLCSLESPSVKLEIILHRGFATFI